MLCERSELVNIISLIDLTSLSVTDTFETMDLLTQKAMNKVTKVAALCVFPQFIPYLKSKVDADISLATVVNFPRGESSLESVETEIKEALQLGVDEIDLVIPYTDYIQTGSSLKSVEMVQMARELCQGHLLKVIIESGALPLELIATVSKDMINAGADFLKTSTGKVKHGATLTAAKLMLEEIIKSDRKVGFKASGGIRTLEQAQSYIKLARAICGDDYIAKSHFRFGVSGLLDNLLNFKQHQSNY